MKTYILINNVYTSVYNSSVYNSQKVETTQVPINEQ